MNKSDKKKRNIFSMYIFYPLNKKKLNIFKRVCKSFDTE